MNLNTRPNWYIDEQNTSGNASDTNSGNSATHPLLSMSELTKRIGNANLEQNTTIHLLSDVEDDSVFLFDGSITTPSYLTIIGEAPTQLLGPTVLTGRQNIVVGSTRPYIQVTGINWTTAGPGGTSLIGKRARVTTPAGSAQTGTIFWLQQVDGGDSSICYISQPFFATPPAFGSNQSLTVGDEIVVEELTKTGQLNIRCKYKGLFVDANAQASVLLQDVRYGDVYGSQATFVSDTGISAYGCQINWIRVNVTRPSFEACRFGGSISIFLSLIPSAGVNFITAGSIHADNNQDLQIQGDRLQFWSNTSFQGSGLVLFYSSQIQTSQAISFWNWTGPAIELLAGCLLRLGNQTWGASTVSNTYGFLVRSGSTVIYTTLPAVNGTLGGSQDITVGGLNGIYADAPLNNKAAYFGSE